MYANVKFWPARGNQFFNDAGGFDFELPDNIQKVVDFVNLIIARADYKDRDARDLLSDGNN